MTAERMFPIQVTRGAEPHPLRIPWSIAELAFSVYAQRYGAQQSLEVIAARGGFVSFEMDILVPGWRDRCGEISSLKAELMDALHAAALVVHRLRERWPHVSLVNTTASRDMRFPYDPGYPACLRCVIEREIEGPKP